DLDTEKIERELDACLLNRYEIEQDWGSLADPYQWEISKQQ
ncbi:GTP-binding protein, partial [Mammaliicoccus fleurettii]